MVNMDLPAQLEQRRKQLKMSKKTVAVRAGISLPTVNRILAGREKRLTVANIAAIAKALGVVVRLGSADGLDELETAFEVRRQQAYSKARRLVGMLQGTMGLEAQAVDESALVQMVEQTACELLAGSPRRLWNDR